MKQTPRADRPRSPAAPALAGLVHVDDRAPGIRRVRRGRAFAYRAADGSWLRDAGDLERIRRLAIPPAYVDVWICARPDGHLQATGRDARGRKQYRYHPRWREGRDDLKFERMRAFGDALPRIRARVARDLAVRTNGAPTRELVLATLVRLLDTTCLRVGNDEYARTNGSYGLTTLKSRHAAVRGGTLRLSFRGKSGIEVEATVDDPRVTGVIRRCQHLPGQELFRYVDEGGAVRSVGSADVNDYLHDAAGERFTAKDFRTWHGTAHALHLLLSGGDDTSKQRATRVLAEVAARLGNTVAVCRKSYIHPHVLELCHRLDGDARVELATRLDAARTARRGLRAGERRLLGLLRLASRPLAALLADSIAVERQRKVGRAVARVTAARRAAR